MDFRIIPSLQLLNERLVKTIKFGHPQYIGDPVNTVRIFNELEVDELCFLDISATLEKKEPHYFLLQQIANECFMPLSYGGGITGIEQAKKIIRSGFEKIILNTAALQHPHLIKEFAEQLGSQAVVLSIDVKKNLLGKYIVMSHSGTKKTEKEPAQWAMEAQELGAGEILLTSIDREGTWNGFDIALAKKVMDSVSIPVIAQGGAGSPEDIHTLLQAAPVSAVALGSMLVFQKKGMGVLINFPKEKIQKACSNR